tara:strand:- start:48 stop:1331 length:1284 start_codon:yes stop_codon:yes gene_type:complete
MKLDKNKIFLILMCLYPISIIVGPSISLLNTLLIVLIYLIFFFNEDHYKFLFKDKILKVFFLIYFYLIINTLFSINYEVGLSRNLGFIRIILIFVAINYIFYISNTNLSIFKIWMIVFTLLVLDVYLERFTGTNMLGWGASEINGVKQPDGLRIQSFFKDESIVGTFIHGFIFLIIGYLLTIFNKKNKINFLIYLLIFCFLLSIVFTGERSSTIKVIFGVLIFIAIIKNIKIKTKILLFSILISTAILTVISSDYLKNRYVGQMYYYFANKDSKNIQNSLYYRLYKSGFNVFKNSPILGVGNKNYRIETCKSNLEKIKKNNYLCSTHPHQIYFEFLSEHGLLGTSILLSLFFYLIFKNFQKIILSQNYVQIGAFVYLLSIFLPLIPSGSFFNDFNITFFIINLSLMYAVNKDTNIFFVEKNNKNSNS